MVIESIVFIIKQTLILLILLKVILSYFMDPFHPFRQFVDRFVDPLLRPIRQVIPTIGGFDFSPIILLILVEVIATIVRKII